MPLLRLDVGKVFSSLVGSSEENIRKCIRTAEAVAPSILWLMNWRKASAAPVSGQSGCGYHRQGLREFHYLPRKESSLCD